MLGQKNYLNQEKSYLNQVTLIESECEPRKKAVNMPATVFNRSPIRDRENKINLANMGNISGTPSGRSGSKANLSPLRSRKCDTAVSIKSTTNRKKFQMDCTNHPNKTAKYVVESQEESLFYCQKCAILLASQGFKVLKLNEAGNENTRKKEVEEFLGELEVLMNHLHKRQSTVQNILKNGSTEYESEIEKIESYYTQFYQTIDQHKRRVLEEIKIEYDTSCHETAQLKSSLVEAVNESNSMKEDVCASLNSIILQAEESEYRPVMDLYKQKVRKYKAVLNRPIPHEQIKVRKVSFKDGQEICQTIAEGINVEWEDEKEERNMEQSVPQEREGNPLQQLQSEQKFAKSSLKEIGNLFCSFDQ